MRKIKRRKKRENKVPTIEEQTGWKRQYPNQILQDPKILKKIKHYSFKLTNKKFRQYLERRTGISLKLSQINFWQNWTIKDILKRKDFIYKVSDTPLSKKDRRIWIEIVKIGRGKFQDAWELFNNIKPRKIKRRKS